MRASSQFALADAAGYFAADRFSTNFILKVKKRPSDFRRQRQCPGGSSLTRRLLLLFLLLGSFFEFLFFLEITEVFELAVTILSALLLARILSAWSKERRRKMLEEMRP